MKRSGSGEEVRAQRHYLALQLREPGPEIGGLRSPTTLITSFAFATKSIDSPSVLEEVALQSMLTLIPRGKANLSQLPDGIRSLTVPVKRNKGE